MKRKMVWLVVSCLMVLALLAASCAKAEAPATKEAASATKETAPAAKEATPATKEVTPAAAETPKYGGTLIYVPNSNVINWDETYWAMWSLSNFLLANEDLLLGDWSKGAAGTNEADFGGAGQSTPPSASVGLLTESWEFPDDTTLIWHLRKGVHFALDPNNAASRLVGGRELTADDVVFNLKRQFWNPNTTMAATAGPSKPLDISASDKYTVVVKSPPGQLGAIWEYTGYYVKIMAPEIANKYGDYQRWENNVGTGPFILKDFVNMSSIFWVRNPNYYGTDPVGPGKGNQLPYLDAIKYLIVPDLATRMAALRTGKSDADSFAYAAEDAKQLLKTNPQLKFLKEYSGVTIWGMRLDKPELPWAGSTMSYLPDENPSPKDINAHKVRRALNLAINNQEIVNTVFGGEGSTLAYKITPNKLYEGVYTPLDQLPAETRELFEYHPDKAKQLLAEAGYPNGFKAQVQLTPTRAFALDIAQMFQAYWAKIGVDLELKVLDYSVFAGMEMKHTHEQMLLSGRTSNAVHMMYTLKTGDTWNWSIVSEPKLDDYYNKMAAAYFDLPKKRALMKELNLFVTPKAYYAYTAVPYAWNFWQPWLKNFHGERQLGIFQNGPVWKYVWIDQELKKSMGR
ncbi:MAG: hypothetical protein HY528_04640 [Chloroflexi bacterium]|nr:hypothetical protein [Chloroflexota bacterium]